ncbi:hypothetical protein UFOVP119_95 [uncultured Caudovirales phage]|uniref:Uncharacterized protein n=1 Tax=uncultured Caudovirales phage TaxID=2100421 RepID=A0A6J5L7U5_9CAUD|nr:hypothetical protein UFOVP119_95 [uncultured Caudovirales phage]
MSKGKVITLDVDTTVEVEVNLGDIDTEDLLDELRRRGGDAADPQECAGLLDTIYHEYRNSGQATPALREYLYRAIGRVL